MRWKAVRKFDTNKTHPRWVRLFLSRRLCRLGGLSLKRQRWHLTESTLLNAAVNLKTAACAAYSAYLSCLDREKPGRPEGKPGIVYFFFSGSWEITTAANTRPQPVSSAGVIRSWSSHQPPRAANTDSRLIISAAGAGAMVFCPTICRE